MMSRSSSSSRIIKNNNLFHLLKSFKDFGGTIIVLIRDGALQLSSRQQQRNSQTPLAQCRSGDADPAASTPHPSRRSTPGSPTWAPTNLPMERKRQRQVRAPSTVAPHHAHFSLLPSTRESHQKLGPISPKPAPSPPAPAPCRMTGNHVLS